MAHPAFRGEYQRVLAMTRENPTPCAHCQRAVATTLDHDPPLAQHAHRNGTGCCRLIPSCDDCNRRGGVMVANGTWRPGVELAGLEPEPERGGLGERDRTWRVPWLAELRLVPEDGVWPRLMTIPHPRAVGTLGPSFCAFAEERSGRPLRWWQQLVAARMLEVDADDRLVWETVVLSTGRQVGKSWLLRELCLWRILHAERFGEPQDVLHTGKDLAVCKEIQRPARVWAKARSANFRVREVNGQEEIEHLADGSRWMLRAKEAVYGYSGSLGVVDEAWKVRAASVDEGLVPTMAEREQPQLLLVSTAHRAATKLMLERRSVALANLEAPADVLLVEWSAPRGCELDDEDAWRAASPHWTARRRRLLAGRLEALRAGGEVVDPDEPDPVEAFRAQWLNQWPQRLREPTGKTEPLLPDGTWAECAEEAPEAVGPVWIALEDDYGLGAAVGCVRRTEDGRLELDGWLRRDWDSAIADALSLADAFQVRRVLVGASLVDRVPPPLRALCEPCTSTQTRTGLALLRDLAMTGQLVHDVATHELDETLALATVREAPSGLFLLAKGPTHLVRASAWALVEAHRPARVPAVH